MQFFKGFFASKTIWSQIVGVIASMITIWGIDLDADTQAGIVTVIIALQGLFGIMFRTKAEAKIVPPLASPPVDRSR